MLSDLDYNFCLKNESKNIEEKKNLEKKRKDLFLQIIQENKCRIKGEIRELTSL